TQVRLAPGSLPALHLIVFKQPRGLWLTENAIRGVREKPLPGFASTLRSTLCPTHRTAQSTLGRPVADHVFNVLQKTVGDPGG
ncbi:MAG: hypothetical protein ACLFOY_19260, partial [Desulfatibacillaceae bacterium]